jgi:hypothetical protein|tara:strand:+ start:27159 stop:27458 length:300 start_codon:yes stop_codon:yes gene_type:complete
MIPYHERFAEALRAELPEGFTVQADATLAVAGFGSAILVGYPPSPADKRKPVDKSDVLDWIASEAATLRRNSYHFTPEAKAAAEELINALMPDREKGQS